MPAADGLYGMIWTRGGRLCRDAVQRARADDLDDVPNFDVLLVGSAPTAIVRPCFRAARRVCGSSPSSRAKLPQTAATAVVTALTG